jgi:excisionase family DNA binding protein
MSDDQPTLWTPQEIADAQRVDVATIHRALRNKRLKGHQIGRQWRIHHKDYLEWLDNGAPTQPEKQEPTR